MGITAEGVGRSRKLKIGVGIFRVSRAGTGLLRVDVVTELSNGRIKVFVLEKTGLLHWKDLLDPLANCLRSFVTSFLIIFWTKDFCKGA